MSHQYEQFLYQSADNRILSDNNGNVIYIKQLKDGKPYYMIAGIESEAYERLPLETTSHKICISWNDDFVCDAWMMVDICTKSEFVPRGFSNIS